MADITSSFLPGGMLTQTQGLGLPSLGGLPGAGQMPDLSALMDWRMKLEHARAQDEARMRALQLQQAQQDMDAKRMMMQRAAQESQPMMPERRAQGSPAIETPWYTLQGAAMRPVGGPGIIPGMNIDPTRLPPEMRPKAAGFESGGLSDRQVLDAQRSGALQREAERLRQEREFSQPTSVMNQLNEQERKRQDDEKRASQGRQNAYYGR